MPFNKIVTASKGENFYLIWTATSTRRGKFIFQYWNEKNEGKGCDPALFIDGECTTGIGLVVADYSNLVVPEVEEVAVIEEEEVVVTEAPVLIEEEDDEDLPWTGIIAGCSLIGVPLLLVICSLVIARCCPRSKLGKFILGCRKTQPEEKISIQNMEFNVELTDEDDEKVADRTAIIQADSTVTGINKDDHHKLTDTDTDKTRQKVAKRPILVLDPPKTDNEKKDMTPIKEIDEVKSQASSKSLTSSASESSSVRGSASSFSNNASS